MTLTPNNPIKTVEELKKLEGKEIYRVSQSGYLTAFKFIGISSFNEIYAFDERNPSHWGWAKESYVGNYTAEPFKDSRVTGSLGDVNIGGSHNEHHLFANKEDADDYSNQMKTDPEYIQGVAEHHARCAEWDNYDWN